MFFTQDDYKKIQQWLTKNSVKDTEFNEANIPFNGEETITIVQGNQNKKVFLKDLIAQVFNLGISDFVNITDKYDAPNISLEEAIRLIPSRARKEGQVITFLDMEDHWHIYQFKGVLNQWNVLDTWEDLFDWEKLIIDSILPDEEDLTKSEPDANGNSYLSLKDREYKPEDFSGLGRVILRKNIVEIEDPIYGKVKRNILYQDMINKENTVYEIRYDFDLGGNEIIIPEDCILKYEGGSLNNGHIVYQNTKIQGIESLNNITTEGLFAVIDAVIDEEDLHNNNGVLKFANREYNPNAFSGLGKIILRKNIVNGKNILTQGMISNPNTIYIIQYDYDLNGAEIIISEGCVLDFQGGSLNNGNIIGNNTAIKAELVKIFGLNINISGNWNIPEIYSEWFGAKGDGITDDTTAFRKSFKFASGGKLNILKNKIYAIKDTIEIFSDTEIIFNGKILSIGYACFEFFSRTIEQPGYSGVHNVYIHGCGIFDCNGQNINNVATPFRIHHCSNITIEGITFKNWYRYHVIEMGGSKNVTIKNVTFKDAYGQLDNENAAAIQLERCSEGGTNGAIPYDYTITKDLTISGCTFTTENYNQGFTAIESHDFILNENKDEESTFSNIIIKDCIFKNIPNQAGDHFLIKLDSNYKNVRIENNIFDNIYERVIGLGIYTDNIYIYNNIFKDLTQSAIFVGCNINIPDTNNHSNYITILNNKFIKCSQIAASEPVIYINKQAEFLVIEKNYAELYNETSSKLFHMPSSAYSPSVIFKDNIISNVSILNEAAAKDFYEQISRFEYRSESAPMGFNYTNYFTNKNTITTKGPSANRPKSYTNGGILSKDSSIGIGFTYFDTDLGKPIYVKNISSGTVIWVDATGADV